MRTALSGFLIGIALGIASMSTAWAEDNAPVNGAKSVAPVEAAPQEGLQATTPATGEQGIESRGLIPKIRALSSAEIALAKSVFQNTINSDMVRITDTLGAVGGLGRQILHRCT